MLSWLMNTEHYLYHAAELVIMWFLSWAHVEINACYSNYWIWILLGISINKSMCLEVNWVTKLSLVRRWVGESVGRVEGQEFVDKKLGMLMGCVGLMGQRACYHPVTLWLYDFFKRLVWNCTLKFLIFHINCNKTNSSFFKLTLEVAFEW